MEEFNLLGNMATSVQISPGSHSSPGGHSLSVSQVQRSEEPCSSMLDDVGNSTVAGSLHPNPSSPLTFPAVLPSSLGNQSVERGTFEKR